MGRNSHARTGEDRPLLDAIVKFVCVERNKLREEMRSEFKATLNAMKERLATMNQRLIAAEKRALSARRMPRIKAWAKDGVAFENDLFSHAGSLWQARQNTGQEPGGDHWTCIARGGKDGASVTPRGEHDPGDAYSPLDIVTRNGHAYICVRDDPGVPSQCDDWMLLASRGAAGPRGHKGRQGDRGEKGDAAREIQRWEISRERFAIVPFYENGTSGPPIHLRKFFEEFVAQTSSG